MNKIIKMKALKDLEEGQPVCLYVDVKYFNCFEKIINWILNKLK